MYNILSGISKKIKIGCVMFSVCWNSPEKKTLEIEWHIFSTNGNDWGKEMKHKTHVSIET